MKNKHLIIFMPSIEGGGVEKNLFIITKYLASKNKEISLITASNDFNQKFKNINLVKPKVILSKNCSRKLKYIFCLVELLKLILFKKNVSIFSFQANLYCILLCKIFNKKIIVRANSSPSGWSKTFIRKLIFKYIFSLADIVIVNSVDFKKQFKLIFNINATCIYNPLNKTEIIKLSRNYIQFPFFKKNDCQLKIITIGRFTDQKDHMTLLRALNEIKNKINFKILVIGRGVNENKIRNYILKNDIKKYVKILSYQKNPYQYIRLADLFILSSKFEGLPNVLLEAAVLKKFIISSNCPTGPREILNNGKGGFLFNVGNYKELSKKIIEYSVNKKKLYKKINFNYQSLSRFDSDVNLKKYSNEVSKIIN